jgi:hypothetical protein
MTAGAKRDQNQTEPDQKEIVSVLQTEGTTKNLRTPEAYQRARGSSSGL